MELIRDRATAYENAYNQIQASIERQDSIQQIREALPQPGVLQVNSEKERLSSAKTKAMSEKGAYVRVRCRCCVSVAFLMFFSVGFMLILELSKANSMALGRLHAFHEIGHYFCYHLNPGLLQSELKSLSIIGHSFGKL